MLETESVFSSPLQSGPNVPFGQHTLIVSMQNHLCRSGCFVFLNDKESETHKCELQVIPQSVWLIMLAWSQMTHLLIYIQVLTHSQIWLWQHLHLPTPTSWTTRFRNALRALRPCRCTRSYYCHTAPPQSPSAWSHCKWENWCMNTILKGAELEMRMCCHKNCEVVLHGT